MSVPLKPTAVLCRDGARFAVETADGLLVVTAPAGDLALEAAGLSQHRDADQARPGVLRHSGVPIDVVRGLIRAHGGYVAAGSDALAALQAASRPDTTEDVQGGGEAAPDRPFREGLPTPRLPSGSRPGITVCVVPGA